MKLITSIAIFSIILSIVFCVPFDANDEPDLNQQKRNVNDKLHQFFNWDRTARLNWLDHYLSELGRLKKRDADFNEPISTTPKGASENEMFKIFEQTPTTEGNEKVINDEFVEKAKEVEKLDETETDSDCLDFDEGYDVSYDDECDESSSSDSTCESESSSDDYAPIKEEKKKRKRSENLTAPKYSTKYLKHLEEKYRLYKANEKLKKLNSQPEIRNYKKNSKKHPKNLSYEADESYSRSDDESDSYEHEYSCETEEDNRRKMKYQPQRYTRSNRKNHYIPVRRYRRDLTAVSKRKHKKYDPREVEKKHHKQSEMNLQKRSKHIY